MITRLNGNVTEQISNASSHSLYHNFLVKEIPSEYRLLSCCIQLVALLCSISRTWCVYGVGIILVKGQRGLICPIRSCFARIFLTVCPIWGSYSPNPTPLGMEMPKTADVLCSILFNGQLSQVT